VTIWYVYQHYLLHISPSKTRSFYRLLLLLLLLLRLPMRA
jgi:hypothetical protein